MHIDNTLLTHHFSVVSYCYQEEEAAGSCGLLRTKLARARSIIFWLAEDREIVKNCQG
jgi:hypothetical protein